MAQIIKRTISLTIAYQKDNPDDLTWRATAQCATPDDKEDGGEEIFTVATDPQTITRAQFRSITGAQIETTVVNAINAKLQTLGSGAGSHTLTDDFGN